MTTQPEAIELTGSQSGRSELTRSDPPRPPRAGWRVVAAKEFTDGILSLRFVILIVLLGLPAIGAIYSTAAYAGNNAAAATGTAGLFVAIFSFNNPNAQPPIPSFVSVIALLGPLLGIAFGFDAINGERSERTLPRLVAQPIHRDAVIIGKFVGGLAVIGLVLGSITLLVSAVAFIVLGVSVGPDEIFRLGTWFLVALAYLGFWLAFAMLCSVIIRRTATSLFAAIAPWIILAIFAQLLVGVLAGYLAPVPANPTVDQQVSNAELQLDLARISPSTLYIEASAYLLDPAVQTVGIVPADQATDQRAIPSTLAYNQSLLLAWPQIVALIALSVGCFGLAYVSFMRQEVRA